MPKKEILAIEWSFEKSLMERKIKKYVFKPYLKVFPELYENEKARILSHAKIPIIIEHVGSTAVPNLGGKGIIDIAIAVNKQNMEVMSKQLQEIGYEFRAMFSTLDRFYFVIYLPDALEEIRRYHIHLTYPESNDWKDFLNFRDYLKSHPEELQEYAEIKKQAAFESNQDGKYYRKLKETIFKKILTR